MHSHATQGLELVVQPCQAPGLSFAAGLRRALLSHVVIDGEANGGGGHDLRAEKGQMRQLGQTRQRVGRADRRAVKAGGPPRPDY